MTNNDKGIAYVHADLKPDNIVVGVPEEKTKGSSTDDSGCDIHPRVTMIDFGGMFRLSKRGPTDRVGLLCIAQTHERLKCYLHKYLRVCASVCEMCMYTRGHVGMHLWIHIIDGSN